MSSHFQPVSPHHGLRRSECIGPLVLSEVIHKPDSQIGWHLHKLAALVLTLQGSSVETFGYKSFERTKHGVLLRPAGERHRDSVGREGETCFLIELREGWGDDFPRLGALLQEPALFRAEPITQLAERAHREWHQHDTAAPLAIQALVYEIAARLVREDERHGIMRPPEWLERVKARLDDNFAETPSMVELGKIGGMHPTHVARQFRQYYHLCIGEYLRELRISAAIKMLERPDLSVTEIAMETGFCHHTHLCMVFKAATGMTPTEFRRTKKRSESKAKAYELERFRSSRRRSP